MVDLAHQHADAMLALLGGRDVAGNLRSATMRPAALRTGEIVRDTGTSSPFLRLRMVSKLSTRSPADALDDPRLLILMLGRNEQGDILANSFLRPVAKKTLCAAVPRFDDAIQILAHDRVEG